MMLMRDQKRNKQRKKDELIRVNKKVRKMGSIEVYDLKLEKWVPYVPDYDKWYQHFKDLSKKYVQPDHM